MCREPYDPLWVKGNSSEIISRSFEMCVCDAGAGHNDMEAKAADAIRTRTCEFLKFCGRRQEGLVARPTQAEGGSTAGYEGRPLSTF